jgi:hypothetical protein
MIVILIIMYFVFNFQNKIKFLKLLFSLHAYLRYHLKDVIVGKIYFLLVRIKIRYMELAIVRRETTGAGDLRWESFGHVGNSQNLTANFLRMDIL